MEHIYKNYMLLAAGGKLFFTTTSKLQVRNMVLNTIAHHNVVEPNWWCADKLLYKNALIILSNNMVQLAYQEIKFVWWFTNLIVI